MHRMAIPVSGATIALNNTELAWPCGSLLFGSKPGVHDSIGVPPT
jgi:hypothetical protein